MKRLSKPDHFHVPPNPASCEIVRWRERSLDPRRRPIVMGILNVTPDSFSDGGQFLRKDRTVARGLELVEQGADCLDVGGESTRPGADAVSAEEQKRRVVPVVRGLRDAAVNVPISVDTRSSRVAEAAIDAGADAVNDVSALRDDPRMIALIREAGAGLVLMHMQGRPGTMQDSPRYADVVAEVRAFLEERVRFAIEAGVQKNRLVIDPGIGFGKTLEHNLLLLHNLAALRECGVPILIGVSRKAMIGQLLNIKSPRNRVTGTMAAVAWAYLQGATLFRVHDVRETVQTLAMIGAIRSADEAPIHPE